MAGTSPMIPRPPESNSPSTRPLAGHLKAQPPPQDYLSSSTLAAQLSLGTTVTSYANFPSSFLTVGGNSSSSAIAQALQQLSDALATPHLRKEFLRSENRALMADVVSRVATLYIAPLSEFDVSSGVPSSTAAAHGDSAPADRSGSSEPADVRRSSMKSASGLSSRTLTAVFGQVTIDDAVANVQTTWAMISDDVAPVTDLFYRRLFTAHPALKQTLFAKTDLGLQGKMLATMIDSAVRSLTDRSVLLPALRELALRHCRYGALASHYEAVGAILLETLEECLGSKWSAEVCQSWTMVYGIMLGEFRKIALSRRGVGLLREYYTRNPPMPEELANLPTDPSDFDDSTSLGHSDSTTGFSPIVTIDVAAVPRAGSRVMKTTLVAPGDAAAKREGASAAATPTPTSAPTPPRTTPTPPARPPLDPSSTTTSSSPVAVILPTAAAQQVAEVNFDLFTFLDQIAAANPTAHRNDIVCATAQQVMTPFAAAADVPLSALRDLVQRAAKRYRDTVPYHNFVHALDVTQTLSLYLARAGVEHLFSPQERFTLLVTGLLHDLDHTGVNNGFHLKAESNWGILAKLIQRDSVLEVRHCMLASDLCDGSNIFATWDPEVQRNCVKLLFSAILATDMARHGEFVAKMDDDALKAAVASTPSSPARSPKAAAKSPKNKEGDGDARRATSPLLMSNPEPETSMSSMGVDLDVKILLFQLLMKAADVANVSKEYAVARKWAEVLTTEFFQQGDQERELGLPSLPVFNRATGTPLEKSQISFIDFVALPYFTALSKLLPGMTPWKEQVAANRATYEKLLQQQQTPSSS